MGGLGDSPRKGVQVGMAPHSTCIPGTPGLQRTKQAHAIAMHGGGMSMAGHKDYQRSHVAFRARLLPASVVAADVEALATWADSDDLQVV